MLYFNLVKTDIKLSLQASILSSKMMEGVKNEGSTMNVLKRLAKELDISILLLSEVKKNLP